MLNIGIIGSAGRKDDAMLMSKPLYMSAYRAALGHIRPLVDEYHIHSGGAAWMDHLAISLYLSDNAKECTLHLPCEWDDKRACFTDDGTMNWKTNPGGTLNYYHRQFSKKVAQKTLDGIQKAIQKGANVKVYNGLHARNTGIADASQHLVALTFNNATHPKDGGTMDTWRKSKATKWHINLFQLDSKL